MQTDTHHELALQIAESLHRRMLALEAKAATPMTTLDAGLFDVDGYLGDAEKVLEKLHSIQNYEETIRYYAERLQGIYALLQQEPINWFLVINEILDVLSGEDGMKAARDQQLIDSINTNLGVLETMKDLYTAEKRGLQSEFNTHSGAATLGYNPFEAMDDAHRVV